MTIQCLYRVFFYGFFFTLVNACAFQSSQEESTARTSNALCSSPNTTFCESPISSNDCSTCDGTWTALGYCDQTALCGNPSSCASLCAGTWINSACHTSASQEDCLAYAELYGNVWVGNGYCDQTAYCSDYSRCVGICGGTWTAGNRCRTSATQEDCLAYAEQYGNVWVTGSCSNQNTSYCVDPSDSSICSACGGTWGTCSSPNTALCESPESSSVCATCSGTWTALDYCDQTAYCNTYSRCTGICGGSWVDNTCRSTPSREDCLAYAELYGNVWVSNGYCDQTALCGNASSCSSLCAGTWIDSACHTSASKDDCLAYAELYGNKWISGTCSDQNATYCTDPTNATICSTCGGTWGNCSGANTTLCHSIGTLENCTTCGGTWAEAGYCDQTALCSNASSCTSLCAGTWVSGTCRSTPTQAECLAYAELYGNVWVSTAYCDQTALCGDATNCTNTCAGTWIGNTCHTTASQEDCLAYAELYGNKWVSGTCSGQNADYCEEPSGSSACVACGGTWE